MRLLRDTTSRIVVASEVMRLALLRLRIFMSNLRSARATSRTSFSKATTKKQSSANVDLGSLYFDCRQLVRPS